MLAERLGRSQTQNGSGLGLTHIQRRLAEVFVGRSAAGMTAAGRRCGRRRCCRRSIRLCCQYCHARGRYSQSRRRCRHRICSAWVVWAGERSGKSRRPIRRHHRPHRGHVHGAMVRPMPPAAGRQVHVLAAVDQRRQGHEPEHQHQDNGEAATHLTLMVHDSSLGHVWPLPVRYHRIVACSLRVSAGKSTQIIRK